MEHFTKPHNVGEIKNPDGEGEVGNARCGDVMRITIKVKDNRIKDIKFKTFGCVSAIASTSVLTDMAKGKTLEEAEKLKNSDIVKALDGLPQIKIHCSVLADEALRKAIADYRKKSKK
jgi:nitrogen fixation NifU-like protein